MIPASLLRALAHPALAADFQPRPVDAGSPFLVTFCPTRHLWTLSDGIIASEHETLREAEEAPEMLARALMGGAQAQLSEAA